jgi:hypothetical protein
MPGSTTKVQSLPWMRCRTTSVYVLYHRSTAWCGTPAGHEASCSKMSEKGLSVVKVESSNRHVHLSAGDLARLFGPDYALEMHASLAGIPEDLASLTGFASHATFVTTHVYST